MSVMKHIFLQKLKGLNLLVFKKKNLFKATVYRHWLRALPKEIIYVLLVSASTSLLYANENQSLSNPNWCIRNFDKTNEIIDELKKEAICLSDQSSQVCQSLFFPSRATNSASYVTSTESQETQNTCLFPSNLRSASTLNALRLLKPVDEASNILGRQYVNSLEDFIHHTQLHKKRVLVLIEEAYRIAPHLEKEISKKNLIQLMVIHDDEKLLPYSLRDNRKPYYHDLYKGYGTPIDRTTIIDPMNEEGAKYFKRMQEKLGLSIKPNMTLTEKKSIQKSIKAAMDMQKLVDEIDRMLDKVAPEELAHPPYPLNPSQTKKYGKIARHLIDNYPTLTKDLQFTPLSDLQRFKLHTRIKMQEIGAYLLGQGNASVAKNATLDLAKGALHVRNGLKTVTDILNTKAVKTGMLAIDGALLLTTPSELGCADLGITPYQKNSHGHCYPVPGLSSEMMRFLLDPNLSQQMQRLTNDRNCQMLLETKKLQERNPTLDNDITCNDSFVRMTFNNRKSSFDIQREKNGPIRGLKLNSFKKNKADPSIHVLYDGQMEEKRICFNDMFQNETCYSPHNVNQMPYKNNLIYKGFLKKKQEFSFHIFKAMQFCENKYNIASSPE